MAFQPTEHGCKVVARFQFGEERWSNTIWCRKPDFSMLEMQNLVNAMKTTFIAQILNDFSVSTELLPFRAYDMRTIDGAVLEDATGTVPCTGGTNEMPPNNACVLTLYTAKRGRAHRGRLFVGPFTEELMQDGEWTDTLVDVVEDLGDAILSTALGNGWDWGVRSGQLDGEIRDPAIITPITTTTVRSNRIGSQRRRIDRG